MIRPLADRLIVQTLPSEETTKGGIVLPDGSQTGPRRGKVLAVGTGRRDMNGKLWPPDVAVGDTIIFNQHAGQKVESSSAKDKAKLLMIEEREVLGVL